MAQWPIVRTQRTMPGRAGGTRGSLNIPDDAQRTWREVQGLFEDIGDEVKRRRLQRIANQTAEFKVRYAEEEEKFSAALAKNQDESTYPAEYEKFNNNVSSTFMPKDPLAAQAAQLYVRAKAPAQRKIIRMLQDAKIKDTWFAHYGQQMTDAEQGKISLNEFKFTQMEGVALGHIKKEQAGTDLRETKKRADHKRWIDIAKVNPEELLDSVKTIDGKERIGLLPDLTDPGIMMEIKNIAKGAIDDKEIEKGRLTMATTARINKMAATPGTNTIVMEDEIRKNVSLGVFTPEQGINAMSKWIKSRDIMATGGSNPYTTTSNWELYTEHRKRAANRTITEQEIMDNAGSTEGYSWPEAEKLLRVINGKDSSSKAFEDSAAAENLKKIIGDTIGDDVSLNQFATQRGMGLLEDAIQSHPDWTDREKKEEALRVGRRIEREYDDGLLETELERTIEITTEQRAEAIEKDLNKIDLSKIKKINKGIPEPKTKAEYDALPVGTTYIHPKLGRVVKR